MARREAERAPESAVATLAALFKQTLGDRVERGAVVGAADVQPGLPRAPATSASTARLEKILSASEQIKARTRRCSNSTPAIR